MLANHDTSDIFAQGSVEIENKYGMVLKESLVLLGASQIIYLEENKLIRREISIQVQWKKINHEAEVNLSNQSGVSILKKAEDLLLVGYNNGEVELRTLDTLALEFTTGPNTKGGVFEAEFYRPLHPEYSLTIDNKSTQKTYLATVLHEQK